MTVKEALDAAEKTDYLDVQLQALPRTLTRSDLPKINNIIGQFLKQVAKWNTVSKEDWFLYVGCTVSKEGWQCNSLDQHKYIRILTAYNKLYQFQQRLRIVAAGTPTRSDIERERLINYPYVLNYKKVA